ncbi:HSP70-domain-containing protein [Irpex rosettiformis]|uniref:HSP70-domain-containing protein n=1 Tax=Irpex rosettiformis TaxID=378272 RepID=A0ACB8UE33_9APHY|nr:HSP70-domain-containing protein [Irpex rosettiformis]
MTRITVFLVLCLSIFTQNALASVLAIDYGSDWIKASLMSPGVPFDVLLDRSSKRKIQSTVGWKREDRLFGSDAFNVAGRFPTDSFSSLKYLQAASYDSQSVSFYKSISQAELAETSRGTVALKRPDGTEWSVEELIAMQLAYIRDLAESAAQEKVVDVILTVPPYYTVQERDAVVDAIEIAGMKTLALIHDGTAVAVNYAMTRTFSEKPEYHVIYDAGASSIRATIVGFSSEGKKSSPTTLTVKGVGYDRSTGGTELDRRLREILVNDFVKKHKKDIRQDKRGMAKLWKEAGRVKAILSANAEAMSSVESVAFDIDYRSKVTRKEFENACKDLKIRFAKPIFDALSHAGLSLDNVTSVILAGGASRTPMIQAAVKAAVGESKIALNVNADEAAVLGAALHGASLSRQFKTKDIRVTDITPYDIQVSYNSETKSNAAQPRVINTVVFPSGSKHGNKKTLTFKRKDDFVLRLAYKSAPVPGYPTDILEVSISGIQDAYEQLIESGATDPVVKATVVLSESGFANFQDVVAFGEIKDDSLTGKLKSLLNNVGSTESESEKETEVRLSPSSTVASEGAGETSGDGKEKKEKEKEKPKDTIPLKIETKWSSIPPMTGAEKRTARDRLRTIDLAEAATRRKEEARNALEAYLYRVRDLLEEEGDTPFRKCSTEEERKALGKKLEDTFDWLHEDGDHASTADYVKHRTDLEKFERPVVYRYNEIKEFPHALNNSQMWNWQTRMFITEAKMNLSVEAQGGEVARYTQEEVDSLEKTLKEHETWLNEVVEKQKGVMYYEDPAVEAGELRERAKVLESALQRMVRKKVTRRKTTSSSSSSREGTKTGTKVESEPTNTKHDEL